MVYLYITEAEIIAHTTCFGLLYLNLDPLAGINLSAMVENMYPWDLVFKMTNTVEITGVSLSEPHTGVVSLHLCVCMFACLLTVNHFRLLFCVITSYVKFKTTR